MDVDEDADAVGVISIASPEEAAIEVAVSVDVDEDEGRIGMVLCMPGVLEPAVKGLRRKGSSADAIAARPSTGRLYRHLLSGVNGWK